MTRKYYKYLLKGKSTEYNNSHPPLRRGGCTRPIFSNSEKGRIQLNPLCGIVMEKRWWVLSTVIFTTDEMCHNSHTTFKTSQSVSAQENRCRGVVSWRLVLYKPIMFGFIGKPRTSGVMAGTLHKNCMLQYFHLERTSELSLTCLKVRQIRNDFFQADISSKIQTNKFDFTTCRFVFVHFLEESEETKKIFRI